VKRNLCVLLMLCSVILWTACSSSSNLIYFVSDRDGQLDIYSIDPDSGDEVNVTGTAEDEYDIVLSSDRKFMAFSVGRKKSSSIDILKIKDPERFTITKGTGRFTTPRWSPDGNQIALMGDIKEKGAKVYIADIQDSSLARLSDVDALAVGDWSNSGDSVVFSSSDKQKPGIHDRNPDGVNQRQVTCGEDYSVTWSPDSSQIAFLSKRDGNPEIYVMDKKAADDMCDGNKESRLQIYRLTESDEPEYDLSWSPDGKKLLFVSERDGNAEIYVMEASGNKQTRLTYNDVTDHQPVWSPDGKTIVFVSELDGDSDIFVMNDKGENQTRLTNNEFEDFGPTW
jgi:Tol biopolymer transport system component